MTISPDVYRLDSKEKVLALLANFKHNHYVSDGNVSLPNGAGVNESILGFDDWQEIHRCEQALKCLGCFDVIEEISLQTNRRFPLINDERHSLRILWRKTA